jgi:hypothetical protein
VKPTIYPTVIAVGFEHPPKCVATALGWITCEHALRKMSRARRANTTEEQPACTIAKACDRIESLGTFMKQRASYRHHPTA